MFGCSGGLLQDPPREMVLAMKITIEIPDDRLHSALESPHSRYWTNKLDWDPETCTGHVIDMLEDDKPIIELERTDMVCALLVMAREMPKLLARFIAGETDGPDGDSLLQLMAFGELKY